MEILALHLKTKKEGFHLRFSHPLSRLESDVGPHAPGDAWGPCADLLCRPWKQELGENQPRQRRKSWTHSRPSSAGQTWAWSPCRRGRCGRAGRGGGQRGGKTLPAAQKASSELSLSTPPMSKHQKTFTLNYDWPTITEVFLEGWVIEGVGRQCFSPVKINLAMTPLRLLHDVITRIVVKSWKDGKVPTTFISTAAYQPPLVLDKVILSEISRKAMPFIFNIYCNMI